jgi:endoplasmic reticulum Man9GlcNAc2 1,2-alpha-mannosidase
MDEYHPISQKGRNMVEGGFGWMIVDALDTAMMMNLTSRVLKARDWISTSLTYSADHDVNTFETTIRMLGGLLSAQYLSTTYPHLAPLTDDDLNQPGEDLYIEKATDLADRLLGAYDSPTGIPYASINLNTSMGIPASEGSSTAEATTLQLEMKYLSKLTGEPIYWQRAEQILEAIDKQHMKDGLLPIFIDPASGSFKGHNIRLGSRGDSYYEYLIKQYLQTKGGEPLYLDMWEEALEGMKKHLITYTKDASLTVLAERQNGLAQPLTPKMDHLVCFMPGTIALAVTNGSTVAAAKARLGAAWTPKHQENLKLAEELMKTCWGMYAVTPTGLAPEITYFNIDSPPRTWQAHLDPTWTPPESSNLTAESDAAWRTDYSIHQQDEHNLQRPETVESLYYMWQITENPIYREWGWKMFESFREHTSLVDNLSGRTYAYSSLSTVMQRPVKDRHRRDNMESFWLAETLKYFYLLFSDDVGVKGGLPGLEDVVINTEAHFLPRFSIEGSKIWKTGWVRQKKEDWLNSQIHIEAKPVTTPRLENAGQGAAG